MTYGIYRPMYTATYRAALDANKNLIAFHVKGGGIPEHADTCKQVSGWCH